MSNAFRFDINELSTKQFSVVGFTTAAGGSFSHIEKGKKKTHKLAFYISRRYSIRYGTRLVPTTFQALIHNNNIVAMEPVTIGENKEPNPTKIDSFLKALKNRLIKRPNETWFCTTNELYTPTSLNINPISADKRFGTLLVNTLDLADITEKDSDEVFNQMFTSTVVVYQHSEDQLFVTGPLFSEGYFETKNNKNVMDIMDENYAPSLSFAISLMQSVNEIYKPTYYNLLGIPKLIKMYKTPYLAKLPKTIKNEQSIPMKFSDCLIFLINMLRNTKNAVEFTTVNDAIVLLFRTRANIRVVDKFNINSPDLYLPGKSAKDVRAVKAAVYTI